MPVMIGERRLSPARLYSRGLPVPTVGSFSPWRSCPLVPLRGLVGFGLSHGRWRSRFGWLRSHGHDIHAHLLRRPLDMRHETLMSHPARLLRRQRMAQRVAEGERVHDVALSFDVTEPTVYYRESGGTGLIAWLNSLRD